LKSVSSSYDIIGHIAILRLTDVSKKHGQVIAEVVMRVHKNVKTVLAQTNPVKGRYRLRNLEYVAGETHTLTRHKESGCSFIVDIKKCYFSPRLLYERMRIAKQIRTGEIIINMFAGVGCFSIVIAKHAPVGKIYSIDINPNAVQYMRDNTRINCVSGKVISICGDAKAVIEKRLYNLADRVLMPLPLKAKEYLPYALKAIRRRGGWIHYYDFEYAKKRESAVEKTSVKIAEILERLGMRFAIPFGRVVRSTGPHWYQVVLDIVVTK
jgi:tRNA (guanine37-N1)-methyltransferase